MALLLVVTAVAMFARVAAPWISLGVVAGVLVLGCLAVCVYTAITDDRAWRRVERELERLRQQRAQGS